MEKENLYVQHLFEEVEEKRKLVKRLEELGAWEEVSKGLDLIEEILAKIDRLANDPS